MTETFCGRNNQGYDLLLAIMRSQRSDCLQLDANLSGNSLLGQVLDPARTGEKPLNKTGLTTVSHGSSGENFSWVLKRDISLPPGDKLDPSGYR